MVKNIYKKLFHLLIITWTLRTLSSN